MVKVSSRLAICGLIALWLTLTAVLLFVSDVLFDSPVAVATSVLFAIPTVTLWFVPPLLRRRSAEDRARRARQSSG